MHRESTHWQSNEQGKLSQQQYSSEQIFVGQTCICFLQGYGGYPHFIVQADGEVCTLTMCCRKQAQDLNVEKRYLGKHTLLKAKSWEVTEK